MPSTRKRRTRTKSPTASCEVVAPGGGTQNDVNKLAKNLGLPNDAVSAILNCEGNGIPGGSSSRTSRSSIGSGISNSNPVVSSAWADFMNEEGFGGGMTTGTTATEDDNESNKRSKMDDDAAKSHKSDNAEKSAAEESAPREYELPILRHMPSPGILAQTGTLDSVIVGRTKRVLTGPEDFQEPTILAYESIFKKQKVAFIAASCSSAHSIAITTDGDAYAWGRNESGQCGLGSTSACVPLPTKISLAGKFVAAAVGKNHSILVEDDGSVYAVGGNKCGQCGVNTKVEAILNWRKCVFDNSDDDDIEIVQVCFWPFYVLTVNNEYCYFLFVNRILF